MKSLDYLWRLLATGICFASFSLGALVLSLVVIPLVNLHTRNRSDRIRRTRWCVHMTLRKFTQMMSLLGVIEFDTAAAGKILARQRGKVIIANHPSLIDVVVLISVMPHANCIIKKDLWENRFLSGVLKAADYIRNSGDPENLIRACQRSLDEGYALIIFPEGTRTTPGQEMTLQRGASNIALLCKADLVPVLIQCKPTTLTKNEKWYSIPPTKVHFSLQVDPPFELAQFDAEKSSRAIKARQLTAQIKSHYMKSLHNHE